MGENLAAGRIHSARGFQISGSPRNAERFVGRLENAVRRGGRPVDGRAGRIAVTFPPVAPAREAGPRRRRVQAFSPWAKTLPQGGFTPPEDFKYPGPHGTRSGPAPKARPSVFAMGENLAAGRIHSARGFQISGSPRNAERFVGRLENALRCGGGFVDGRVGKFALTESVSPPRRRVSFWMPRKKPKRHQGAGSDERSALIFVRPYPLWPSAISP